MDVAPWEYKLNFNRIGEFKWCQKISDTLGYVRILQDALEYSLVLDTHGHSWILLDTPGYS